MSIKAFKDFLAIIGLANNTMSKLTPFFTVMDSHSQKIARLYNKAFKSVIGKNIDVSKIGREIDAYLSANNYIEDPTSIEDNSTVIMLDVYKQFGIDQNQIEEINKAFESEMIKSNDYGILLRLVLSIQKEVYKKSPDAEVEKQRLKIPSAKLKGADDGRLNHREKKLIGRVEEVNKILGRLGDGNPIQVVGVAGIGKTEVCKASLKEWLKQKPSENAYFINIPDNASPESLFTYMGSALGINDVENLNQLRPLLDKGLYYIDNLESIISTPIGRKHLEDLKTQSSIQIMFSSRVALDVCFDEPISIEHFSIDDAMDLFLLAWNGKTEPKKDDKILQKFVKNKLSCHALSLVLTARLGDSYSLNSIYDLWEEEGTKLVEVVGSSNRLESLQISLSLTSKALFKIEPKTLNIWTVAALFANNFPEQTAKAILNKDFRFVSLLCKHSVLVKTETGYTMLSPIAQYALDESLSDKSDFSWESIKNDVYTYFGTLAKNADIDVNARLWIEFQAMVLLNHIKQDYKSKNPETDFIDILLYYLSNTFQFFPGVSKEILGYFISTTKEKGLVYKALGDVDKRLMNFEDSAVYYSKAIKEFEKTSDEQNLANTYLMLGVLKTRLNKTKESLEDLDTAMQRYNKIDDKAGLANTYKAISETYCLLLDNDKAVLNIKKAIDFFEEINDKIGLANSQNVYASILITQNKNSEALDHVLIANKLFKEMYEKIGYANSLRLLGEIQIKLNYLDDARTNIESSIEIYRDSDDILGIANSYSTLADLELKLKNLESARFYCEEAIESSNEAQDIKGKSLVYLKLGFIESFFDSQKSAENFDKAIVCAKKLDVPHMVEKYIAIKEKVLKLKR